MIREEEERGKRKGEREDEQQKARFLISCEENFSDVVACLSSR